MHASSEASHVQSLLCHVTALPCPALIFPALACPALLSLALASFTTD